MHAKTRLTRLAASPVACLGALLIVGSAAYVVRPGDTLSGIASRAGVPERALAEANRIKDPNRIHAGQRLDVPGAVTPTLVLASATTPRRTSVPMPRPEQRRALMPAFSWWSLANRLPVDLVLAVTWMESGWQNHRVSSTGAVGIGQLMPDTAVFIQDVLIGRGRLDPRNPEHNIRMSARYLRFLLDRSGGDVRRAVASYYQGPGSVDRGGLLPETVRYVDNVVALRRLFAT